jgi:hypothetical protein
VPPCLGFDISHAEMGFKATFNAIIGQTSYFNDALCFEGTTSLPISQRISNDFTRGRIVTGGNGLLDGRQHVLRQGDGNLFDIAHMRVVANITTGIKPPR